MTTQISVSPVNMEERKSLGIRSGDTVRVWQKIQDLEKGKTRLQAFEGLVLARKHGNEAGGTFTVRKVSGGVGVEKIFPLYSPLIDKIEITKRARVRRAKLYHIRDKATRQIRREMRRSEFVDLATGSDIEDKAEQERVENEALEEKKEVVEETNTEQETTENKQEENTESEKSPEPEKTEDAQEKTGDTQEKKEE